MAAKPRPALVLAWQDAQSAIKLLEITKDELKEDQPDQEHLLELLDSAQSSLSKARSGVRYHFTMNKEGK